MLKLRLLPSLAIAFALSTWMRARPASGQIKDAESATHADAASMYQVVDTYKYPGFEIVQFTLSVLSHYSYIVTSGSDALLVDPGRDVQTYLDFVKEHNLAVKGVFLTHSHADFVAGHIEMKQAAGCPIYASATSGAQYEHVAVKEGDEIALGEAVIRVIETEVGSAGGDLHGRHVVCRQHRAARSASEDDDRGVARVDGVRHVAQQAVKGCGRCDHLSGTRRRLALRGAPAGRAILDDRRGTGLESLLPAHRPK